MTLNPQQTVASGRVVVAMSGGVDSSVVAALLQERGVDTVGISMRLYETAASAPGKGCCSPDDLFDARAVAADLGMPFYVVNYQETFRRAVIENFLDEYRRGRTPSPCVLCNNHVKFDTLLSRMLDLGGRTLATGHYARIEQTQEGRYALLRGVDPVKDQSYFLFGIAREALPQLSFPLGGLTKVEVRTLAERFGLLTARKPESQDLCFVGGGSHLDFLDEHLPADAHRPGDIVDVTTGSVVGQHEGIHRYTVGQRRGLGIGGSQGPLYVVRIEPETSRVYVGQRSALLTRSCTISSCNWLAFPKLGDELRADVQIRYRHRACPATLAPLPENRVRVTFHTPQAGVSPGQALVAYNGDEVLGGGWIDDRTWE